MLFFNNRINNRWPSNNRQNKFYIRRNTLFSNRVVCPKINKAESCCNCKTYTQNFPDQEQLKELREAIQENRLIFEGDKVRIEPRKENEIVLKNDIDIKETKEIQEIETNIGSTKELNNYSTNIFEDSGQKNIRKLMDFIQNERNASIFYKYLSSIARKKDEEYILTDLSIESLKRSDELNNIYKQMNNKYYELKTSKINNDVEFSEGINWAIWLENKELRNLIYFYESLETNIYNKKFYCLINRKMCDISLLSLILSSKNDISSKFF